jgi:hypothetical protein
MKKLLILISFMALFLLQGGTAPGAMILDTGTNSPSYPSYALRDDTWFAGKFTTSQTWNVGAMEGYIRTFTADMVAVSIYTYSGDGTVPAGTPLFTKTFQSQPTGSVGWQGTTGFAGTLAAGSYWIAFEVRDGSTFYGSMGAYAAPPNGAMSPEAYTSNGEWLFAPNNLDENIPVPPLYLSVRIAESQVPVPGALWLLGSGLVGLVGWRKFRKA